MILLDLKIIHKISSHRSQPSIWESSTGVREGKIKPTRTSDSRCPRCRSDDGQELCDQHFDPDDGPEDHYGLVVAFVHLERYGHGDGSV